MGAFALFPWRRALCYESASACPRPRRGGATKVRIDRFPDVDVDALPANPSPPDLWQDRAACFGIDPDVFFPISEEEAGPALTFCNVCTIREECLAWALKNGERYGVWGATTEQQRRRLQRHVA